VLDVRDLAVLDSLPTGTDTPATVSLHIEWDAKEAFDPHGLGSSVAATEPGAFLARTAAADSTAVFSGFEFGFSFHSDPGVSTERGYAQMGRERNGSFL
jgi:hypothetical protein